MLSNYLERMGLHGLGKLREVYSCRVLGSLGFTVSGWGLGFGVMMGTMEGSCRSV